MITRRSLLLIGLGFAALPAVGIALEDMAQAGDDPVPSEPWAKALIDAATGQIGVTVRYDPSYRRIGFPNGDVPMESGVCTDVVVRAYRTAFGFDHQAAVNADMRKAFRRYPKKWGLKRPDRNIDHRRVHNLATFWTRRGAALPDPKGLADWQPGDLVAQRLPGNLPHLGIVADTRDTVSGRLRVIHNIGDGTQIEDILAKFEITGRYRFAPARFA
jgi:uncharacterized protein